ncbi:late competence development ComFB family protein [bacterium]|nr:late competence development ComFB family protein [bacterium]
MSSKTDKYTSFGVSLEHVRNVWETKVIKCMDKVLPDYPEFDYCSICIQDVYALAMNQLNPKYIQQGTVMIKKEYSDDDFRDALALAVEKVIKKPNHD